MFYFYEVNFEVKVRKNVGKICETIKNEDTYRLGGRLFKGCFLPGQLKFYNFNTMPKEILLK